MQLIKMMAMKTIFQRMLRKPGCDRALIVLAVFLCGRTAIAEGYYDFDRAGLTTGLIAGQDDWENLRGTTSAQVVSGGALNTSLVLSTSGGEAWCARTNNGTFQVAFNATESDAVIQFQARLGLGPAMIGFGDPTTANRVMFGFQGAAVVVTAPGLLQLPPRLIAKARTGDWMHLHVTVSLAPGSEGSAIIQVKNLTRGDPDFTTPPGVPWPLGVNSLPAAQKPARWDRLLANLGPAAALDNLVVPGRGGRGLNHRPVAVTGQSAPGLTTSIKFEGFDGSPVIGPNGQLVFAGRLLQGGGVGPANNRGLWAGKPGQLGLVALQATFGPQSQPDTMAGSGCWVGRPGALRLLAATGQPAPGIGSSFAGVGEIAFNDRDQVAFRARLNEAGPGLHQSLWATDTAGELHLLLREGDYLEAGANRDRQVKGWTGGFVGGGIFPRNFSNGGEVAVSVTFTDNSQAVEVFRAPGSAAVATPEITASPLTQTAWVGGTVTFSVTATGEGPLTYRWLHDHQPVAGETGPTLTLDNRKPDDAGAYQVEVTNAGGAVLSAVAHLTLENSETDTDGDGLSDVLETQNGFNQNDPSDAAGDPDGDGWTNLQEFIAGTNPRDPKSFLSVGLRTVGGAIKLNFLAAPGKGYSLLFKDRLSDANWQKLR